MKTLFTFILLIVAGASLGQNEIVAKYRSADSLMQLDNFKDAYPIFKELEAKCDKKDTLYNYILWYYVGATTQLENQSRMAEQFESSLKYGLEAIDLIQKGKSEFGEKFNAREYWMHKNLIVSYFGLGQLDKAEKHKEILYKAEKAKKLPEGLDEYFNFTFYKWEGKNVWGYEWYEELPKDRFSKSFSKVVYYVYSTNEDGTDKDQLYRLHVLMFHKLDESGYDYVLTKYLETAKNEKSGTLYAYGYNEKIDYEKLQLDIKEVLKGNYNGRK